MKTKFFPGKKPLLKKNTASDNVKVFKRKLQHSTIEYDAKNLDLFFHQIIQIPTKRYPVIYMQDAQNLFNEATSFSGEWKVDETLNQLFAKGNSDVIVVGIENGGAERLNEYSPWKNAKYGGGKGDAYTEFLAKNAQTLHR